MNNSNKKRYFSWLIKAVVVALGSLLPAHLTANNGLSLSDSAESQSTTITSGQTAAAVHHTIRFPARDRTNEDLASQFFQTLYQELAGNRSWVWPENDPSDLHQSSNDRAAWVHQHILFNGERQPLLTVMREQTAKAFSRAAADTFNATPWGREVKAIEERLSRYFVVAFSKNRFDAAPDLHYPGEAAPVKINQEKEYMVSLRSSFYADLDSLEGDYALTLDAVFHDSQFQLEYDFGSDKISFRVDNSLLDRLFGVNAALSLTRHPGAPPVGLLSLSWRS